MTDIEKYFLKSGDNVIHGEMIVHEGHGFTSLQMAEDRLIVMSCFGDGGYWDKFHVELAIALGLKKIMFGTRRNYKAFERKFGYKKIGYILEKEVKR